MIYLITGLPGNGKTLYTLWHVRDRAKKENRQVYVSGIPDLAITEWNQIDEAQARDWHTLPDGAIIVIDEAQRIFRPRAGRGDPPAHVSMLETHRHKGYDIYLITQHPSLIDQNVRRLSGTHRHIQRTFGMQRATIHEWGEVHMDCELRRTDSSKTIWNYPKDVYSLYKSAELHTHKVQLPKQVWYLVGLLSVLIFCVAYVYTRTQARMNGEVPGYNAPGQKPDKKSDPTGSGLDQYTSADRERPLTPAEYVASLTPRIPELPHTAPRYDKLTTPTDAPYPAGCYTIGDKCKCVTQQGTPFKATHEMCINVVKNGFFKDWGNANNSPIGEKKDPAKPSQPPANPPPESV